MLVVVGLLCELDGKLCHFVALSLDGVVSVVVNGGELVGGKATFVVFGVVVVVLGVVEVEVLSVLVVLLLWVVWVKWDIEVHGRVLYVVEVVVLFGGGGSNEGVNEGGG